MPIVLTQYEKVFNKCKNILENSKDKNMKNKERRLIAAFDQLCKLQEPTQEFYSLVHEITLYDFLLKHNINPVAGNDMYGGPDFSSEIGYIECVSATMGENGTPERKLIDWRLTQDSNRYLSALSRLTSVIQSKRKKYADYIDKRVIDKSTPLIIAVSSAMFTKEFCGDMIFELAMKILYGIGSQTILFDRAKHSFISQKGVGTHVYDDIGIKSKGKELKLNYFANEDFNIISAVLVTKNVINEDLENRHVAIFANPNAINKLDTNKIDNISCLIFEEKFDDGKMEKTNYKWLNVESKVTDFFDESDI
ncbi:MAG: hypothetical protein HFE33_02250 [Clostridia bacterium]|jgi:hypothetical protein|nr:hypothetical protein [Clostridia bacterium]MCI8944483.1 hypothetical protein [Clostridia bacterium]MCI9290482.1 hypothetical protein [Clostridia bacterium]